jgi:hypothetical protein
MDTTADLIVLNDADNVGTALHPLQAGNPVRVVGAAGPMPDVIVKRDIRFGHKAALYPIAAGALVVKHGRPIGKATTEIGAGEHVHVHNVVSLSRLDE